MSFNNSELMAIISGLVGHNNVIVIPTAFIEATGDKDSAQLLAQCLFWQGKLKNGREWFWKTDVDWQTELYMSRHELTKAKNKLKSLGILNTMVKKANGDPTCHYQVPADALINWFCRNSAKRNAENQQNDLPPDSKTFSRETAEPLTETTSKTTNRIEETESLSRIEKIENIPSQSQPQSQTPTSTSGICETFVGVVVGKSKARKNPHGAGGDGSGLGVAGHKSSSVDVPGLSSEDVAGVVTRITAALNVAIDSTFRDTDCQKHIKKCLGTGMTEAELMAVIDHVQGWVGDERQEDFLFPSYIFGSRAGEYARKSKKSNKSKPRIVGKKRQYYLIDPAENPTAPLVDEDEIPVGTDAWDREFRRIVL